MCGGAFSSRQSRTLATDLAVSLVRNYVPAPAATRKPAAGVFLPESRRCDFGDWRIELIDKLRDILSKWPDSIRLYLLVLSFVGGVALAFLLHITLTQARV
jgi:hypothetical protein